MRLRMSSCKPVKCIMEENLYLTWIYKRLEGTISPNEESQLDVWIAESSDNQQTLKDVEEAWNASANLSAEVEIDLDAEFAFLEERIEAEEREEVVEDEEAKVSQEAEVRPLNPTPIHTQNKKRLYWAVAAGLILLITAGILAPRFLGGEPELNWMAVTATEVTQVIDLDDETHVTLSKGATLRYPEKFAGADRPVELTGNGFFEVAKNPEKPFRITTSSTEVTVLGTEFSVMNEVEEKTTRVAVTSGKVQFKPLKGDNHVILEAGQTGTWDPEEGKLKKENGVISTDIAWVAGQLIFEDTPLSKALEEVGRHFQVEIEIELESMKNCPFSSVFETPELDKVMEVISTVFNSSFEKLGENRYLFKGGEC